MTRQKRVRTMLGWRWLTALGLAMSLLAGILVTDSAKAQNQKPGAANGALSKYAWDLTAAAERGDRMRPVDRSQDELLQNLACLDAR